MRTDRAGIAIVTRMSSTTKPWRIPLKRANAEPAPRVYRGLAQLVRAVLPVFVTRTWTGGEKLPATGGVLVVANHISNFDVLVLGEFVIMSGRWPRFLGKAEIWKVPVIGWLARSCEQIPVLRNTASARDSLIHARRALEKGRTVAMYPEGTITADPQMWPMTGRTGAARLALETGVPVLPVGQCGADRVLGGKHIEWRRLFSLRRRRVSVAMGDPVDLSRFRTGDEPDKETLEAATVAILDAVTELVEQVRGEHAPEGRWDMRVGARVPQLRR